MASMIVNASEFSPEQHIIYTRPKANQAGGKSVGILNTLSKKALYLHSPLMMTWGANVYENPNGKSYDICLQFPREEFGNKGTQDFLQMLRQFEEKVKTDAQTYARDWFGKPSMSREVIDALWSPMLKYPKNQTTMEPDTTRSPTLKLKLPAWQGEFKFELFDTQNNTLIPNEDGRTPDQLIPKGCEIACIIQCGGIWFANGKFGVTWKLFQGVVKPVQTLAKGMCHIKMDNFATETVKVDETHVDPNYDSDGESNVVVSQSPSLSMSQSMSQPEQSDPDVIVSQSAAEPEKVAPVKKTIKSKSGKP